MCVLVSSHIKGCGQLVRVWCHCTLTSASCHCWSTSRSTYHKTCLEWACIMTSIDSIECFVHSFLYTLDEWQKDFILFLLQLMNDWRICAGWRSLQPRSWRYIAIFWASHRHAYLGQRSISALLTKSIAQIARYLTEFMDSGLILYGHGLLMKTTSLRQKCKCTNQYLVCVYCMGLKT